MLLVSVPRGACPRVWGHEHFLAVPAPLQMASEAVAPSAFLHLSGRCEPSEQRSDPHNPLVLQGKARKPLPITTPGCLASLAVCLRFSVACLADKVCFSWISLFCIVRRIKKSSRRFRRWPRHAATEEPMLILWQPPGILVLSETAHDGSYFNEQLYRHVEWSIISSSFSWICHRRWVCAIANLLCVFSCVSAGSDRLIDA